MQLFYNPTIAKHDQDFYFNKNESRHIVKVLRKKSGDKILITNGLGYIFESKILLSDPNKCQVKILKVTKQSRQKHNIHLAVAPTKLNDRFEWFLEKATEIGVDEITPIFCTNSERKVIKPNRYNKIIHAAAKQSLRAYFPILRQAVKFKDFVHNFKSENHFIAHCMDTPKPHLKSELKLNQDVLILIGPEGDFTTTEIELAEQNGFKAISLGNSRMRTETAAVMACHTVQLCHV